jgi:hypothetical protein
MVNIRQKMNRDSVASGHACAIIKTAGAKLAIHRIILDAYGLNEAYNALMVCSCLHAAICQARTVGSLIQ